MSLSAAADGAKSLAAGAPVLSAGCHSGIGAAQCRAAARIDVLKAARQSVGRAPQNRSIPRVDAQRATNNWTMIPDNWEQLRREWEYSLCGILLGRPVLADDAGMNAKRRGWRH